MRIDRGAIVAALTLLGCKGSNKQAAPVPKDAAPVVAVADAAPSRLVVSTGTSTQCVLLRLAQAGDSLPNLAHSWSTPAATDAAYVAALDLVSGDDDERAHLWLQLAAERAMNGDVKGARAARAQGERLKTGRAAIVGANGLGALLGDPPGKSAGLDDVPFLVRGGQRAAAEKLFTAEDVPQKSTGDADFDHERALDQATDLGGALAALGRFDDLLARLAAAKPDLAARMAHGWLRDAVWSGERLEDAAAAMVARRAADSTYGLEERDDDLMMLIETAHHRGRAKALAPLLHALRTKPAPKAHPDLLWQLRLAYAVEDDAEVAAVEAAIAAAPVAGPIDPRPQVPVIRAISRGTLDEALAAIQAYRGPFGFEVTAAYDGILWARHVSEGADPAFEQRLAAAVCAHPAACLVDDVGWSTVRIGSGGAAIAPATLKAGISDACGVQADRANLNVVLAPDGHPADVIAAIGAGLDAGYKTVTLRELAAADAAAPTERTCVWNARERGHDASVMVQIHRGVTTLITSPDDPAVEIGPKADADAIGEQLDEARTGMMARYAEVVIDADVSAAGLARIVFPLCERYPNLKVE